MEAQTGTPTTSPPQPRMSISCSCSCPTMAIFNLMLRTLTFLLLFIALIVLTTASWTDDSDSDLDFNSFYAYRYTLYTIIIGMAYALVQIGLAIFRLASGKSLGLISFLVQFDFYADKFISYTVATGAAAAFGFTVDAKRVASDMNSFWDKTSASASLLLLAFICSALSSIFSSLALSKRSSSIVEESKENIVEQRGSPSSVV